MSRSRLATVLLMLAIPLAFCANASALSGPDSNSAEAKACPQAGAVLDVTYACELEFQLPASNSYRIKVDADFHPGSILLSAEGPDGGAYYNAPARVTAQGIEADLGRLGHISVRFHPSGRTRRVRLTKSCQREPTHVVSSRLGRFVGTIDFRGERGFTKVSAGSASGAIGDPASNSPEKPTCRFHESASEHSEELESAALFAGPPGKAFVTFTALRLFGTLSPGPGLYTFVSSAIEKRGKLSITRVVGAPGNPGSFVFDSGLTSATVDPPAPFTGTASFQRNADGSTSWSGSLAAPLPGLGTVAMTGGKAVLETVAEEVKNFEAETVRPTGHR